MPVMPRAASKCTDESAAGESAHTTTLVVARPHTDARRAPLGHRGSVTAAPTRMARPTSAIHLVSAGAPRVQAVGATVTNHAYAPGTLAWATEPSSNRRGRIPRAVGVGVGVASSVSSAVTGAIT